MIKYLVTAIVLLVAGPGFADVRLPKILGSHMVVQRNSEVKIWGWADPGEAVSVKGDWLDAAARTEADKDGKWQISIMTGDAGGPHSMVIAGNNSINLDDILFGEVWIGSGQSNMEMPLIQVSGAYTGIKDSEKEVAAAKYPEIRLFQVGNFSSKEPSHFEIAGDDMVFHPATAVIDGDELIVSSDQVAAPKAVRYGFTSQAMPNLMNQEGLPASSFRTDHW